jgi:8-oxoguanine deaminase
VVEDEAAILADTQRLIERWHDPGATPCSASWWRPARRSRVSRGLMRDAALLAREHGVSLHTHLAENDSDIAYTREKFGCTPAEYAEQLGWLGPDVWHAHCVKLDAAGIAACSRAPAPAWRIARAPTCAWARASRPSARCATPACRWASAVDGSASNDSGHLLGEARLALLLQRVGHGATARHGRARGWRSPPWAGARAGPRRHRRLAPGMAADIVAVAAGRRSAWPARCTTRWRRCCSATCRAWRTASSTAGSCVRDGELATLELPVLVERHNRLARQLAEAAHATR